MSSARSRSTGDEEMDAMYQFDGDKIDWVEFDDPTQDLSLIHI